MTGRDTIPSGTLAVVLLVGTLAVGAAASAGGPVAFGPSVVAADAGPAAVASPAAVAGDTTVRLQPATATVDEGSNRTLAVVVPRTDGGVGAVSGRLTVAQSEYAEIADFEFAGDPGVRNVTNAGDTVHFEAAIMDTAQTGAVTIAEVTVRGTREGTTDLALAIDALGDEAGDPYDVGGTPDTALTVNNSRTAIPLAIEADADGVTGGESVTFTVTREDSGARVEATVTVGGRTVGTGVDGRATVTIRESTVAESGTVAAVASKDATSQERFRNASVTLDVPGTDGRNESGRDGDGTTDETTEGIIVRTAPGSVALAPNGTATVDIVVADADGGVGAGNLTVRVGDPAVAGITNATLLGDPGIGEATVAEGGGVARATFALRSDNGSSPAHVLRLTLRGTAPGSTGLSLAAPSIGDAQGNSYFVASTQAGDVTVGEDAGTGQVTVSPTVTATTDEGNGGESPPAGGTSTADGRGLGLVTALLAIVGFGGLLVGWRP